MSAERRPPLPEPEKDGVFFEDSKLGMNCAHLERRQPLTSASSHSKFAIRVFFDKALKDPGILKWDKNFKQTAPPGTLNQDVDPSFKAILQQLYEKDRYFEPPTADQSEPPQQ